MNIRIGATIAAVILAPITLTPFRPLAATSTSSPEPEANPGRPTEGRETDDSVAIRARAAMRWELLTYPGVTVPSQPWTKAEAWVEQHVTEGPRWPHAHDGLRPGAQDSLGVGTGAWTLLGPRPLDQSTQQVTNKYGLVTGRFTAVAVDPRTVSNPGAIVAFGGAAAGGVWKSSNCCNSATTWTSLWEGHTAVTQAVSSIELDPNDADVIYAGTGDFDDLDQISEGTMKTTDGGQTWAQLGANVFTPYAPGTPLWRNQNVGVIRVDPNNSLNVLAGTEYELFISHDAGVNWTRCALGANPTDPTNSANPVKSISTVSGIVLDASARPTKAYIAVGNVSFAFTNEHHNGDNGVYSGTVPDSGCPALTLRSTASNGWPTGTGNGVDGASNVGRIRLASSRGNATQNLILYAQVSDDTNFNALGTWVTTDQGSTWRQLTGGANANYVDCHGSLAHEVQDFFDLTILADPDDDKTLYIGRTDFYKATVNGGYSSMSLVDLGNVYASPGCPGGYIVHPDQHAATWISGGATKQLLVGNDGGVYVANGTVGGFTQMNSSISATEIWGGQIGANFAGGATQYVFAGTQDEGTADWTSSLPNLGWQGRIPSDGFWSAFDPIAGTLSAGNWYGEQPNGQLVRSTGGAAGLYLPANGPWASDRPYWSSPFIVDTFHCTSASCSNLIFGAAHLYGSANGASSWTKAGATDLTKGAGSVLSLNMARSSPTTVVVGTTDGKVQWSNDVFTGANCTNAAANTSAFACTPNAGATWVDLTQANAVLPNRAILGVTFDPTTTNVIYAALHGFDENTPTTPGHLFQCTNQGGTWTWVNKSANLPDVPAWSVVVNPTNAKQVFVGTELGFFYTDDITLTPPLWHSYQYGLPTTVVEFLTVDRGPASSPFASTTLAAFTYGRGLYTIRLPGSTGFPPHPVPPTMRADRAGSSVNLTYDPSSCPNANNNVYVGALGDFTRVTSARCAIGTGGSASVSIPAGSWFVLAGSDDGAVISSFGSDSQGGPEVFSSWPGLCSESTQDTTTACP